MNSQKYDVHSEHIMTSERHKEEKWERHMIAKARAEERNNEKKGEWTEEQRTSEDRVEKKS